jgi:hypothetical protein
MAPGKSYPQLAISFSSAGCGKEFVKKSLPRKFFRAFFPRNFKVGQLANSEMKPIITA